MIPNEVVGAASGLTLSVGWLGRFIGPLIGRNILDLTGSLNLSLALLIRVSIATAGIIFKLPDTGEGRF
jgi:hypothetical protein